MRYRPIKILRVLLGDDPVLDRPDNERHVAGQVRQVILTQVALLESLKVNERMIPCVEKEIPIAVLPVVRAILRSTLGQCPKPK